MRAPDGSRVEDYDYALPAGRIARYPADRRDESRLLVLPAEGVLRHGRFPDLLDVLRPGDLLVANESKVIPARLLGRKPTGAPAEVLLVRPLDPERDPYLWEALVRPGSKLKPGRTVVVSHELVVEILDSAPGSGRRVRLVTDLPLEKALERYGHVPLPPYLDREDEAVDRVRYQTVYATTPGSVAAPTAGLHFTPELLSALEARGVGRAMVTLHVGIGTFRPIEAETPEGHEMHREPYVVPETTARAIETTREAGGRVWAVGTTTVRTLESVAEPDGRVRPGTGETALFIRPPHRFRVVDGLLTNFHLPRSTLLMLVAALGGYPRVMDAYRAAIAEGYRFYSYGDAMVVEGPTR